MAVLDYEIDIKPFIPVIAKDLRHLIEKEVFIRYPQGLANHYGISRKSAYRIWTKKDFPRVEVGGVKGVYLSELKEFEKQL